MLSPNCLQMLAADDKRGSARKELKTRKKTCFFVFKMICLSNLVVSVQHSLLSFFNSLIILLFV